MTKISELPSHHQHDLSGQDYVKNFSKRMLKTQLFIGSYEEKRFVQPLNCYRDVVRIHPNEKLFIENLLAVKHKIQQELAYLGRWIGITEPSLVGAPAGHCLWVTLPIEVFGTYWFQVKSVQFSSAEVCIKLEVVRPVEPSQPPEEQAVVNSNKSQFFKEIFTVSNIKHSVIFLSLLVSTLVVGAINLLKFLLEFLLKFMNEFSGLVKSFTPIVLTCLDLGRRTVFGAFSFVLALIYGAPARRVIQPYSRYREYRPMIEYPTNYRRRPHYRSSVTIQPLDNSDID